MQSREREASPAVCACFPPKMHARTMTLRAPDLLCLYRTSKLPIPREGHLNALVMILDSSKPKQIKVNVGGEKTLEARAPEAKAPGKAA
jgi:hypothetical protein